MDLLRSAPCETWRGLQGVSYLEVGVPQHKIMHWAGGVWHNRGTCLPGWPCCCSGERAEKIGAAGAQTRIPHLVTCKRCIATMRRDTRFAERFPRGVGRESLMAQAPPARTFTAAQIVAALEPRVDDSVTRAILESLESA